MPVVEFFLFEVPTSASRSRDVVAVPWEGPLSRQRVRLEQGL